MGKTPIPTVPSTGGKKEMFGEMFGEMFEERNLHLMKCLCPIAWAWSHVVAGRGLPVEGVEAVAVAVADAIAVAIGLSPLAMSSRIMMLSRRGGKSSCNFSFRRRGTSHGARLPDGLRQRPRRYTQRPQETPHDSQGTPHEPQVGSQVPQDYSGDRPARSDDFLAFVVAWRSMADLFYTWAAWVTKVSPPLRETSTCPVFADCVVFEVAVLLSEKMILPTWFWEPSLPSLL
jgi:hypothetical protein